jgi:hypothetical protein
LGYAISRASRPKEQRSFFIFQMRHQDATFQGVDDPGVAHSVKSVGNGALQLAQRIGFQLGVLLVLLFFSA